MHNAGSVRRQTGAFRSAITSGTPDSTPTIGSAVPGRVGGTDAMSDMRVLARTLSSIVTHGGGNRSRAVGLRVFG